MGPLTTAEFETIARIADRTRMTTEDATTHCLVRGIAHRLGMTFSQNIKSHAAAE